MYVKYDFSLESQNKFFERSRKRKLLDAVRDTFKVVDITGYNFGLVDHNAGVQYKDAVITSGSIFHMWKFWDDTDCTTGYGDVESSRAYRENPVFATYIWEKANNFYKALGTTAKEMCIDMNSNDGITIGHFRFDPSKIASNTVHSPTAINTAKYINATVNELNEWHTCTLSYARTTASVLYLSPRIITTTFDRLTGLTDDIIISDILSGGYTVADPFSALANTNLTFKEKQAYDALTPAAKAKLGMLWHNGNMKATDAHPSLALSVLDDGTIFEKKARIITSDLVKDTDFSEESPTTTYTISLNIEYSFRRKTTASASSIGHIVDQLVDFPSVSTSWTDKQILSMIDVEFPVYNDDLFITLPLPNTGTEEGDPEPSISFISVEKFDAMYAADPLTLYDIIAGTATTQSILDVYIEKEKSSHLVRFLTFVGTAVLIYIAVFTGNAWLIVIITAGYAGAQYLIATHGKIADAQTVGKGATMFSIAVFFASMLDWVTQGMKAIGAATVNYASMTIGEIIVHSVTYVFEAARDAIGDILMDIVYDSTAELLVKGLAVVNIVADAYVEAVNPPVDNVEPLAEPEPGPELFSLVQKSVDSYQFCELNTKMELMPYDMTQGLNDRLMSKYYDAIS